jgi:tetratricopeptide (TPR) repeat protein
MKFVCYLVCGWLIISCSNSRTSRELSANVQALGLQSGDITLCGGEQLGSVDFSAGCSDEVRADFNLATALLHSFEYPEAEKVFARVIDADPTCIMAYWGAAMCSFHPLWEPPSPDDLAKGARVIEAARSIIKEQGESRESDYLETIAAVYDNWQKVDHRTRLENFEVASASLYGKYPNDRDAAVFYALALRAAADPADKSYVRQKKAGKILEDLVKDNPNHPGVVHYLIHVYDYPALASMGLEAARAYASIAPASAHAQHMPSHIFIRLGLWDEAIQSNLNSIQSAQCYARNAGIKGHWDEETHGMDYAIYAYLQKGDDTSAMGQLDSLANLGTVYPASFKVAYSVAAMPARFSVERKDWVAASQLELSTLDIPWERAPWEKGNYHFARALGFTHIRQLDKAREELNALTTLRKQLLDKGDTYKSTLILIQLNAVNALISQAEGKNKEAIRLMTEAADLEDKTEKHSVTPGEIIPARELLADLYFDLKDYENALAAYKADLERHPNRFNGLAGAAAAAAKLHENDEARTYYQTLLSISSPSSTRTELTTARQFLQSIASL